MKKLVVVVGVALLSVSLGARRAGAQGPQGSGAGAATQQDQAKASHSLNPIKWIKRGPKSASEALDAKAEQDKKLTANLHSQGVLPAKMDAKDACANFNALTDCVAALHASKNLGMDWNCLKSNMTGVQTSADMSSCKGPAGQKAISLTKSIQIMKPQANAKTETKNAEKQAKDDLKAAGV